MRRGIALFCLSVLGACAQTVIHAESGPWTANLDGTWRWQSGDNPQWALPAFDDSNWPALQVPGPLPQGRYYWIRLHVQTGAISDPGLLLGPIAFAYEVYWDGRRVGHYGDLSRGRWFGPRWQAFHLPRDLSGASDHAIAIRIGQIGTPFGGRGPRLEAADNRIGEFSPLQDTKSARMHADLQPRLLQLLFSFGLLLAGLYFLLLPPSISQGAAFRWLGVLLLGRTLIVICEFYGDYGPLDIPATALSSLVGTSASVFFIGMIEFPYALFRRRVPVSLRCVECVVLLFSLPLEFAHSTVVYWLVVTIPAVVPVALAAAEVRKQTTGAVLTLILFIASCAATLDNIVAIVLGILLGVRWPTAISVAGFHLWVWDAAFLLWVPAITMQIHKANLRFRDEGERLRLEVEAARHVQQLLLPSQSLQVHGFEIDSTYRPATQVGGDFFQFFPVAGDSLLVVIGDVSGKGMKAALLVSLIVGALQNRRSDYPATVLTELNTILLGGGEGGFTTCCCALVASNGSVTVVNAGHLAPYCNGKEIATPPGLPLGVTPDAEWEEMQIELQPGDRMIWISDGIIEARNSKHELLGFERTQELAIRSASEIARAAQQFGQEDDITVVSITRQPVPVYVA